MLTSLGLVALLLILSSCDTNKMPAQLEEKSVTVTDAMSRSVEVPALVERVICSGAGCLRYLIYLRAGERAVAVEDIERQQSAFDARPYALAHPELKQLPLFGEFRGHDNPELIVALDTPPQVIFKTYSSMGLDPAELQAATGIPVVVHDYGDITRQREEIYASLRRMGQILGREGRAEEVISFFNETITDLHERAKDIGERRSCYITGIASRGPHGMQSTEPLYPPFHLTHTPNVASVQEKGLDQPRHADLAKEKIVETDPEVLFIDLSTLQSGSEANALYQLCNEAAYHSLSVLRTGEVYGVLPYNWYTQNHGSTLANAYFVGKILYPERFADIDPAKKADEIYTFLVGKPVFKEMNAAFNGMAFARLPVKNDAP